LSSFSVSPSSTRPSVLNITWLEHPDKRVNCWEREINENLCNLNSSFKTYFQLVASNYFTNLINVVSLLYFVKERKYAYIITMLYVCPTFQLLKNLTDFHKTLYECYAIWGHPQPHTFYAFEVKARPHNI
jgi:hypothetical protein